MTRLPTSFALLAAALGAATVAINAGGCTVLTNDALPDDAGVFEGGGDANIGAQACSGCIVDQCTAAFTLCLTNEGCNDIRLCATGCAAGDESCKTACACQSSAANADGGTLVAEARYRAFTSCSDARTCSAACGADCTATCTTPPKTTPASCNQTAADAGLDADAGITIDGGSSDDAGNGSDAGAPVKVGVDSCATCGDNKCGDAKKACAIGSECAAFLSCTAACTTATCNTECASKHATGKTSAEELASCVAAGCSEACGL